MLRVIENSGSIRMILNHDLHIIGAFSYLQLSYRFLVLRDGSIGQFLANLTSKLLLNLALLKSIRDVQQGLVSVAHPIASHEVSVTSRHVILR